MNTKVIISSLIGTGAIGGATGIYFLTKENTSIETQIRKKNKKLLPINAPIKLWEIKFHTYETIRKKEHELELASFENLKTWCTNTLKKNFSKEDKDYESATLLCTVPNNRESLLKENKNFQADWKAKEQTYKTEGNGVNAIPNLEDNKAIANEIENWCKVALNNEYQETGGNYALTLKWCTKEGQ